TIRARLIHKKIGLRIVTSRKLVDLHPRAHREQERCGGRADVPQAGWVRPVKMNHTLDWC
ncbi:MAG: hypothetical protein H6Q04_2738, partial [Acidobacteria bacterium]|nr:hypothetical protein [Acidobacteriota bacterium]